MATKEKVRTPQQAKTFAQICKLPRSGVDTKDFWLSIDVGEVTITKQRIGEKPTQEITIPRRVFDKFVRWYQAEQTR
jgi:hypothetical protein